MMNMQRLVAKSLRLKKVQTKAYKGAIISPLYLCFGKVGWRLAFQSKGKSGKHLTGTVIYGYLWNEARDQWLVDPEAADVVKRIFAMTIDGYGQYQIASKLKEEKILIPFAYLAQHGEGMNKNKTFKDVYGWGSSTICNILEKRGYLGHTINFKTRKHEKDADRFIALNDKYENFDKLTIAMLNVFIEKILVHERDRKGSIQTTQEVEIYFNFVGRFVPRQLEKWS